MSINSQSIRRFATKPKVFYLVLLVCSSLLVLEPRLQPLRYNDIDPSFQFGFDTATLLHMTFGTRFISTYGPLGFLTLNYIPQLIVQSGVWLFAYVILLASGVYAFVKCYINGSKEPRLKHYICAFGLIYVLSVPLLEWRYLSLFIVYELILLKVEHKRAGFLVGLSFFASAFLYVKFSLGLAATGSLLVLAVCLLVQKKPSRNYFYEVVSLVLSLVGFVILLAIPLHVAILPYIRTGFLFTSRYSEAMSWIYPGAREGALVLALAYALILAWIFLVTTNHKDRICAYGFLLVPLFIAWKNAVVRQDSIHFVQTLLFLTSLIPIMYVVLRSEKPSKTRKRLEHQAPSLVLPGLIIIFICVSLLANKLSFPRSITDPFLGPARNLTEKRFIAFFRLREQRQAWDGETNNFLASAKLPSGMREKIGDSKVDVFPWEASIIQANNLKWGNRPSPFSFESFDPYFDSANAEFLGSQNGPAFIVWSNFDGVKGIDRRYIAWDEPATFRSIVANYKVIDSNEQFILLKKNHKQTGVSKTLATTSVAWNNWLPLPETKPGEKLYMKGTYRKGAFVKAKETLLRAEVVSVSLKYSDGDVKTFRFSPGVLSQGILVSPAPRSWQDLVASLSGDVQDANKVVAIKYNSSQAYARSSHSLSNTFLVTGY